MAFGAGGVGHPAQLDPGPGELRRGAVTLGVVAHEGVQPGREPQPSEVERLARPGGADALARPVAKRVSVRPCGSRGTSTTWFQLTPPMTAAVGWDDAVVFDDAGAPMRPSCPTAYRILANP